MALGSWPALGAEYVAYSLGVAQQRVQASSRGFRGDEELVKLAGMTRIEGLVIDRESNDLILVGSVEPGRPGLTLDDLAVALRARFVHGQDPVVSIDPMADTKQTGQQHVRYEGGIEDTSFGRDMFDADLRLKKIGMGLLESGVPGLKTDWDLSVEEIKQGRYEGKHWSIGARFWFYPVQPRPVLVREEVVAVRETEMGVFTELTEASFDGRAVEDLRSFHDAAADEFARQMTERYQEVAGRTRAWRACRGCWSWWA